jgi:hypothetical protein
MLGVNNIDNYIKESITDNGRKVEENQYGRTIGIHAPARTGKTLTAIVLIIYYMTKLSYIKGVISNVKLKNLDKLGFEGRYIPLQNIKEIKKEEYKDYIILTDEIRRLLDSRMSGTFKNRFISNILADTGKFRQIHILTDQQASAVDKRIRGNSDAVLYPSMNFENGICTVKVVSSYIKFFEMEAYELWNQYDVGFKFPFREYYDYYDTEQPIEDYVITFEPKDFCEEFLMWMKKHNYDRINNLVIGKPILTLWKEEDGIQVTESQLSALLQYMMLETDLNVRGRPKNE